MTDEIRVSKIVYVTDKITNYIHEGQHAPAHSMNS